MSDPVKSVSEAQRLYRHLSKLWNASRSRKLVSQSSGSEPFTPGRDPLSAKATLASLTDQLGWNEPLAEHELFARWTEIVGEDIAAHSAPVHLEAGQLTVKCDSTAWATQLKLLRHDIMVGLQHAIPAVRIEQLRFLGPDAPSWKKGPRTTPGRGPRDTYG